VTWLAKARPAVPEHVCPYCYDKFTERAIMFRCTGRPGADGKTCELRRDDELARALNYVTPLPPVFAADGRLPRATCPDCGEETYHRTCPHCHSRLPLHFGKVDSRMIALIGASQTGKTVFMTVLINELNHRLGSILDAAFMSCDDETVKSYREYDYRLFEEHALPGRTEPAIQSPRLPLVFRLALTRRGHLGRPREEHIILSFFDTAGEDLTSQESVERNVRYIRNAHAVVLLLDPLQMLGARSQALQETILPDDAGRGFDQPIDVLKRVTELMADGADPRRRGESKVRKPIAVVLSKLDALEHTFAPGTPLTQLPDARQEFDDRDSLAVHHQAQALLHEWDGDQIDQYMRHYFGCYRYFGVSALGDPPRDAATVGDVRPYRVHDPFLWLLSEFGAIPASRG
jgi:GTPase SAR1 family protein